MGLCGLCEGAALGAAFQEAPKHVIGLVFKAFKFKSTRKKLIRSEACGSSDPKSDPVEPRIGPNRGRNRWAVNRCARGPKDFGRTLQCPLLAVLLLAVETGEASRGVGQSGEVQC